MNSFKINVLGITICKVIYKNNGVAIILLGIPVFHKKRFNKTIKIILFGIPIVKLCYENRFALINDIDNYVNKVDTCKNKKCVGGGVVYYEDITRAVKNEIIIFKSVKKIVNSHNKILGIYSSNNKRIKNKIKKIAIFGVLPPENTGIAIANINTFVNNENFDFFSVIKDYYYIDNNAVSNIFHIDSYLYKENYRYNIIILGNSIHNLPYLKQISSLSNNSNYILIHDCNLTYLLICYFEFNFEKFKNILLITYKEYYNEILKLTSWSDFCSFNIDSKIYGLKVLKYITGVTKYIVNNDLAKTIADRELGIDTTIVKLFLPIPKLNINNKIRFGKKIIFGTFGVPCGRKLTYELTKIFYKIKKEYNIDVVLIIAGYNVSPFFENLVYDSEIIKLYNNPTDEEFFELLNSVDYGIQFRTLPLGESSGPISQLLSLGKEVITNHSFADSIFYSHVHVIKDEDCTNINILTQAIVKIIRSNKKLNNMELDKYSFEKLSNLLTKLE